MPTIDLGSVRGPQGLQGEVGPQGPQGIQGEVGPQGPAGKDAPTDQYLPYSGGTMTGPLNMGTNRITNVIAPVEEGDAVNRKYVDDGFAPAGYGLGNSSTQIISSLAKLDGITKNGWYLFSCTGSNIGGYWFNKAVVRVSNVSETDSVFQELQASGGGVIIRRVRLDNGVWDEWEFENPPMEVGVEYRTTERWGGKTVYAKYIALTYTTDIGNASTYTDYKVAHGIAGLVNCVRVTATLNDKYMLPYMNSTGGWFGVIEVNDTNLVLRALKGVFTAPTLNAVIYYTKE